jgi:hypothetical protein
MSSLTTITTHEGNLLWHFLRSIAIASAKHHARFIDGITLAGNADDAGLDREEELSRPSLASPTHASGVFVASPFEEDAERWDGLS